MPRDIGRAGLTKSEVARRLAGATGLTMNEVRSVLDALKEEAKNSVARGGPGVFVIPDICKIIVREKPARPARKGVPNPFKPGELMDVPARPRTRVVRVRPLMGIKRAVDDNVRKPMVDPRTRIEIEFQSDTPPELQWDIENTLLDRLMEEGHSFRLTSEDQ